MKSLLSKYYHLDQTRIMLFDRAFLGLFALFKSLKSQTRKRKILFPASTCPSPVFAAVYAGFKPIFSDISLEHYLMDPQESVHIMDKFKDEIAAIVYIYLFGHCRPDILTIKKTADLYEIPLIEDVAQAFGGTIQGQPAGTIGDASVLSFGYSKQVDAGGGGALLLNNERFNPNEIDDITKKTQRFKPCANLGQRYHDEFYRLRKKALADDSKYLAYAQFPNKFRPLYFIKQKPDWILIKRKTKDFIIQDKATKRNDIGDFYRKELLDLSKDLFLPEIQREDSLYRYSFMTRDHTTAASLSSHLRSRTIHCSNLYLPVSRFYNSNGFENAKSMALKIINLWVDDHITTPDYLRQSTESIKGFFDCHEK